MLSSSAWALREKYLCQRRKIQQKKKEKKQCLSLWSPLAAPLSCTRSPSIASLSLSLSLSAHIYYVTVKTT